MRHMGKSGKTAIWASLAALALLVLAGVTLHETVGLWFLAACAVAYVAAAAEVLEPLYETDCIDERFLPGLLAVGERAFTEERWEDAARSCLQARTN